MKQRFDLQKPFRIAAAAPENPPAMFQMGKGINRKPMTYTSNRCSMTQEANSSIDSPSLCFFAASLTKKTFTHCGGKRINADGLFFPDIPAVVLQPLKTQTDMYLTDQRKNRDTEYRFPVADRVQNA